MKTAATVIAPSIGPAVVTFFGIDVPVLALALSLLALMLARWIAPPPLRPLARHEQWFLTVLLSIFLFLIVTGEMPLIGDGEPLGAGMSVIWAVGLGLSGMFVLEFAEKRVRAMVEAAFGNSREQ